MADSSDLIRAWREATQQLRGLASGIAEQMPQGLAPLQRQAELIEQLIRRQIDLEHEVVRRALAPAEATVNALAGAPDAMRAQASAFRAAATSFNQAADLLELQASALEQALSALRAPAQFATRALRGGRAKEEQDR